MKKIILICILLIGVYSSRHLLSSKTYRLSPLEVDKNITRQEYLGNSLGKIYKNRYGVFFFKEVSPRFVKFESNLFSIFDKPFIYMPILILIIYVGFKKNDDIQA